MIPYGTHTTPRGILTTAAVLEAMAERHHLPIELTSDAAFLEVGRTTWYAILPPAGCVA